MTAHVSDPIFAAIVAHRRAWCALELADENNNEREIDNFTKARDALFVCAPTSVNGLIALLRHTRLKSLTGSTCSAAMTWAC
jgi:hypothetical protein